MKIAGASDSPSTVTVTPTPQAETADNKVSRFVEDYESSGETSGTGTVEDDGWDVVASKRRSRSLLSRRTFSLATEPISVSLSADNPSTSSATKPLPVETKTQRKNAKKAEMKKAVRAAEEEERNRRLAMHKRQLEKQVSRRLDRENLELTR